MSEIGRKFLDWAIQTFGPIAVDRRERARRFLEEAIELGHAEGIDRNMVQGIADRVYARSAGDTGREIGQAMATLEVLAINLGYSTSREMEREFDRVRTIPRDQWQRRHQSKVDVGIADVR